jgi:hypothetical protein
MSESLNYSFSKDLVKFNILVNAINNGWEVKKKNDNEFIIKKNKKLLDNKIESSNDLKKMLIGFGASKNACDIK